MRQLDEYLTQVKRLPPAPAILPKLLTLLNQPDIDCGKVVELITYDPALTASVLQLCNSAAWGGASRANDLDEAISRVGFCEVYRLVASVLAERALGPAQRGYGIEQGELWRHSVTAATAAQTLARESAQPQTIVFTAALLHDIGKLVLAAALESTYARLVEETQTKGRSLLEAEKELLGVQHAEIGARLLTRWNFSAELVAAVEFHHEPGQAGAHRSLAAYTYVGNLIAYWLGYGYGHQAFAFRGREEALHILGLQPCDLERCAIRTVEALKTVPNLMPIAA